jgi:DNA-binding beta-propeller fold protein YncE
MKHVTMLASLIGFSISGGACWAADPPPLVVEGKMALGHVSGRIDHFAIDTDRRLLFVAELGNDSVGIIDLKEGKVLRRLTGLREPQGVAFHEPTRTLYVANAGDGSVRLYQGPDFAPAGSIPLGADADNVRIDLQRNRVVVGYGNGALALIDPTSRKKVGDISLKGHPESFQLDETGSRIFVNVPDARQIAVVDVGAGRQISTLDTTGARSNFPMAFDAELHRLVVAFRSPNRLMIFDTKSGKQEASLDTCGDADDVFFDGHRHRIYVSCGEGVIDVLAAIGNGYRAIADIPTVTGARTSLFAPALDRLYLGVRATPTQPAAIWVLRPQP